MLAGLAFRGGGGPVGGVRRRGTGPRPGTRCSAVGATAGPARRGYRAGSLDLPECGGDWVRLSSRVGGQDAVCSPAPAALGWPRRIGAWEELGGLARAGPPDCVAHSVSSHPCPTTELRVAAQAQTEERRRAHPDPRKNPRRQDPI